MVCHRRHSHMHRIHVCAICLSSHTRHIDTLKITGNTAELAEVMNINVVLICEFPSNQGHLLDPAATPVANFQGWHASLTHSCVGSRPPSQHRYGRCTARRFINWQQPSVFVLAQEDRHVLLELVQPCGAAFPAGAPCDTLANAQTV